jgi:hypothetical protein
MRDGFGILLKILNLTLQKVNEIVKDVGFQSGAV